MADIEKGVGFPIYASDQFSGMFDRLKGQVTGITGHFEKLNGALAGIGLAGVFAQASKAAEEAETATRRLEAIMRATGNTSGYTAAQFAVMADNLARVTQFDDEAFRTATATILRFGDVTGKQLERTIKLSADLAAFMGSDLPAAAETLGKAIASPTQGMDRLQRAVGYFTDQQKAAIKAMDEGGDRLGAQNALLDILRKRIGGTAEVMNQGLTRATKDLSKAINELLEAAGKKGDNSLPVQALDTISSQLRGLKAIIEDGNWFQKVMLLMGGGAMRAGPGGSALNLITGLADADVKTGSKTPGPSNTAADDMVQWKAMADAELATIKSREAAIVKIELERRERQRKLAEEFARAEEKLRQDDVKGWVAHAEEVFKQGFEEYTELGRISDEFWKGEDKLKQEDIKGWVAYIDALNEEWDRGQTEMAKITDAAFKAQEKPWTGFLNGIDSAFRDTWDAWVSKGTNAGKVLRDSLKRTFFDWLYQQFAKPFILNIVASVGGTLGFSGLANAATTAAGPGGSILGSVGSGLGSFVSAVGSLFGGPELLAGAPTFLESLGPMLAAAGPYVAAIGAIYALVQAFGDKGENWKGRLGFGSNANAYTTDGVFGREGFQYLAGDDTVNRQIQAFMASTGGLDRQLAGRLTPAQIAAITGSLSGPYDTRNDGQPAEFAFGKGDGTAAQQLTLEYLQKKYGTVFDQIDTTFAAFIRGYTGKSEDLLKAIGEFAGILDGLDALGVKGLNIGTLRAFQKEGEELGTTFNRIAKQWSDYQNLFLTDAEKMGLAQEQVNGVFASLGIAVPASMEDFKKLVAGIDLSTEAGRTLWEALMAVAPAFASVANASKNLLATFDQLASQRNSSMGRFILDSELQATTMQFMSRNAWTAGMDWRTVAQQIGLITSYAGGRDDFSRYDAASQALINHILQLLIQIDNLGNAAGDTAGTINTLGSSATNAMTDAKSGLWDYLRGLYVNPSTSPLDPTEQLNAAKRQFLDQLGLAQGGDAGAASGLSGTIDRVLGLGRTVFASSAGYVDLFNWITGLAGDFARPGGGAELQRLAYEEQVAANQELRAIRVLLARIADDASLHADTIATASLVSGDQVSAAIASADLSTAPLLSALVQEQGHATVTVLSALVAAQVEAGNIEAARFKELLAHYSVVIYGERPQPPHFLKIVETIAAISDHSSGERQF